MSIEDLINDERYRVEGHVGSGAMATVYKAYDLRLQRIVALKILHQHLSTQTELRLRFEQEAKLAARIDHPNVVRIYDFGINNLGNLFIVSEFIEGRSLTLAQRKYSTQPSPALHPILVALVALEIAKGIEAAHRHSVVHRDLKPDNVLVHTNGEVKLTDFGVARPFDSSMTQAGQFIGSLTYASPEQIQSGKVDARSDVFSFGVILFELLTGQLPFRSSNPTDLAIKITQAIVPPLNQLRPSVPRELDVIVRRCLRADPSQRPQTAEHIVDDLFRYLNAREVIPSSRMIAHGFENPLLFSSTIQSTPILQDETKLSAVAEVTEVAESAGLGMPHESRRDPEITLNAPTQRSALEVATVEPGIRVEPPAGQQRGQQGSAKKAQNNSLIKRNAPAPGLPTVITRSRNREKKSMVPKFSVLTALVCGIFLIFIFRERRNWKENLTSTEQLPNAGISLPEEDPGKVLTPAPTPTFQSSQSLISATPAPQKNQSPRAQPKSLVKNIRKSEVKSVTKSKPTPPSVRIAKTKPQRLAESKTKVPSMPVAKAAVNQSTPSALPTQLMLRTEPGEMTIYINGVFEGLSSRSGLTRTFVVPSGNVLLHIPRQEYNGKQYQEHKQRLRIEPGKTLELPAIKLIPLESEEEKEQ